MDALLTSFLAAMLAEFGDKTQLLAAFLAIRFRRPAPVLMGVAMGGLASALAAGAAGAFLDGAITLRAISLLVAVALLYSGATGFFEKKPLQLGGRWRNGAFVTSAVAFFLAELGDKTQFLTFAIAARYDAPLIAAFAAAAGMLAAAVPAVLLMDRFEGALPLKPIRYAASALFLLGGFIVAINALRLI